MSNVIQLSKYRKTGEGRTPLYVSHIDGTVKANPHYKKATEDYAERVVRIKESLERINRLMAELKRERGSQVYD